MCLLPANVMRSWWLPLASLIFACVPRPSFAQTPSPLQEWQYINAIPLERVFEKSIPSWEAVLGMGGEERPLYDGARAYRFPGGPIFDVRYNDLAFFSTGEGIGINFIRSVKLTAGAALGYDFGRKTSDDENNLHGLPNIGRAPVVKLFANYVVSKSLPIVVRLDLRQSVGRGTDGLIGDLSAYVPLPFSSSRLIMLIGPSMTWASEKYLQKRFGITVAEAEVSSHAAFAPNSGISAAGIGFSTTYFLTSHWLLNLDSACGWLRNSAQESPITQRVAQPVAAFAISYRW